MGFFPLRICIIFQNLLLLSFPLVKCYPEKTNQKTCNKICFSCDCRPFSCETKKAISDARGTYRGLFNSKDKIIDIAKNKAEFGRIRSSQVLWRDEDSDVSFDKDVAETTVSINSSLSIVREHSATFHPGTFPATNVVTPLHSTTTPVPPRRGTTFTSTSVGTQSIKDKTTSTVPTTAFPQTSAVTIGTKSTKKSTIPTTSAFKTHPTYTERKQPTVAGSCCETEWETIVPSEVEFKSKVYKVTHFEDSHQILFRGKCKNENSSCQNEGKCRTDDSQITFVLIEDPDAAESVRFIPVKHSRSCICVVTGS